MNNFDFSKYKPVEFPKYNYDKLSVATPHNMMDDMMHKNEEMIRLIQKQKNEKEAEELRRHNELISAINKASDNGATIIIGDNANDIQIQQNSPYSLQKIESNQALDYEHIKQILIEIKEYFEYPQFSETFKDNTENIKNIVEETLHAINDTPNESLIKKSLRIIKDLAIGASGSLIAAGIQALLGEIPL